MTEHKYSFISLSTSVVKNEIFNEMRRIISGSPCYRLVKNMIIPNAEVQGDNR
jgi:hypothetical protein